MYVIFNAKFSDLREPYFRYELRHIFRKIEKQKILWEILKINGKLKKKQKFLEEFFFFFF